MTVVEQLPELGDIANDDDLPLGHLPDLESAFAIARGERPTRALCGAELLGIKTDNMPFRRCEECDEIARRLGWVP